MSIALILFILCNVVLAGGTVILRSGQRSATSQVERLIADLEATQAENVALRQAYGDISSEVSNSITQIRRDIDRNYRHLHDTHLVDRIARHFERADC